MTSSYIPSTEIIYHLVPASVFHTCSNGSTYSPASLQKEGFIHCSGTPAITLKVAESYFSTCNEGLWVLELNLTALHNEVRFEPPCSISGRLEQHHQEELLFPHIYGSLNLDAVLKIGQLVYVKDGFQWPPVWWTMDQWLQSNKYL